MTVKELKEILNQFPDDLIVMIPNSDCHRYLNPALLNVPATGVERGCNEADGCVFIDHYAEDD